MKPALLLSLLSLPVLVAQEPRAPVSRLDVILLKNGERFEGRITEELETYVQFRIDPGVEVGIARNRIRSIEHGSGAPSAPVLATIAPSDEWFVLHDAEGLAVGWLHASVVVGTDGRITVDEEYEFAAGRDRLQITSKCTASAALVPEGCYYRERRLEPVLDISSMAGAKEAFQPERVVAERIVQARCVDGRLVVQNGTGRDRVERSYPWERGATFPLLARAVARASGKAVGPRAMFDPIREEIVTGEISAPRTREVASGSDRKQVREIVERGGEVTNVEWIDAAGKTVRRELAGPALVAVPGTRHHIREGIGRSRISPALAREAEDRFGLWVPNPAWQTEPDLPPGRVVLSCPAHGASISLVLVDHLAADARLELAADAVANWFRLLHPALKIGGRDRISVRGGYGVRLRARGRIASVPVQATVDVIPHRGQFFVLICRAPTRAWSELEGDFDAVLHRLELEPKSVDPPRTGPLARR